MNKTIINSSKEDISQTLKNGGIATITKKRRDALKYEISDITGEVDYFSTYTLKSAENENLGLEFRLYKSQNRRRDKIRSKITDMLKTGNCYFLTLTFSDKVFERKLNAESRKTYIRKFLKEQCLDYIANIDFGKDNGREHYHAVVVPKTKIDFTKYRKIFDSAINCKKVNYTESSIKLVAKYINKLTNHALKENGHCQRIIFARRSKGTITLS